MGWTAPGQGPVNHKLIYVKQENKLCVRRSISHPLSASEELQLTSSLYVVRLILTLTCMLNAQWDPVQRYLIKSELVNP